MIIAPLFALELAFAPPAGQCREIHYHADGSVSERLVDDDGAISASSKASGDRHARSSVSLSSHGSGSSRSAASSDSDGAHRSVSVTHGPDGCRIVIDERDPSERTSP